MQISTIGIDWLKIPSFENIIIIGFKYIFQN